MLKKKTKKKYYKENIYSCIVAVATMQEKTISKHP